MMINLKIKLFFSLFCYNVTILSDKAEKDVKHETFGKRTRSCRNS